MPADDCQEWPIADGFRVRGTLDVAEAHARRHGVSPPGAPDDDGPGTDGSGGRLPDPTAPDVGATAVTRFEVGADDTAAAMGHPDPDMDVLGSPRLALWFELASSPVMPDRDQGVRHVGVGILVHHLGMAHVGDVVEVRVEVVAVDGRTVHLICDAWQGGVLVASGNHQRVVLAAAAEA